MGSEETEEKRLNEVFDNYYYKGLSCTNTKNPINNYDIIGLFNDFMLMRQIVYFICTNDKNDLPNLKILDAGCGNGRMLRKMCELGAQPSNCYGIDLSRDVIDYAKRNSPPGIAYDTGDIKGTPFKDNEFDFIFNMGVLIHIKDNDYIREIAKEFYRVLKPCGLAFITVSGENVQWNGQMQNITRNFNFAENELLNIFDIFQCVGVNNVYSDNYSTNRNVILSLVMREIETGAMDTMFKLIVLKK